MTKNHSILYILEFILIGGGFSYLLATSLPIYTQLFVLALILIIYLGIGLSHHNKHHDIKLKVVLEYMLISALVFSLFVFLNISKL